MSVLPKDVLVEFGLQIFTVFNKENVQLDINPQGKLTFKMVTMT